MKRLSHILLFILLTVSLLACQSENANESNGENSSIENETENIEENDDSNNDENTNDNEKTDIDETNSDQKTTSEFSFDEHKRNDADGEITSGKGGFLWKVENDGTTVYLQGTVHVGTEEFYPFHEHIEEAYESADIVVPEVDVLDVDLLSSLGGTMMHGVYMDGTTIEDHVSAEVYDKLENVVNEYDLPMNLVAYFKPWMTSTLINQLVFEELGYMNGVDMYFLERAKEDEKEIIELESVSEQYDVLADQSLEFQERELENTLDHMDQIEEEMLEVFPLYLDGDIHGLLDLLFPEVEGQEVDPEYEDYMKALNDDRNVGMTEQIKEFLEEDDDQTYFVIVGAAHLIKDPHILSMLTEDGYNVEHVY